MYMQFYVIVRVYTLSEILMVKKGRSDATPFLTIKIPLNIL